MDVALSAALKALSDASRLRIVGLLAERSMAVEELAAAVELTPGTVVHHLKRLRAADLVESRPRPPYVEYSLRVPRLAEIGRQLEHLATERHAVGAELPGPDGRARPAFEAKVLRAFVEDGHLRSIPAQEKKRRVVLRYLSEVMFDEARDYAEREVDALLRAFHPDVASLRRLLVEEGFLSRSGERYRLRPRSEWPTLTAASPTVAGV